MVYATSQPDIVLGSFKYVITVLVMPFVCHSFRLGLDDARCIQVYSIWSSELQISDMNPHSLVFMCINYIFFNDKKRDLTNPQEFDNHDTIRTSTSCSFSPCFHCTFDQVLLIQEPICNKPQHQQPAAAPYPAAAAGWCTHATGAAGAA